MPLLELNSLEKMHDFRHKTLHPWRLTWNIIMEVWKIIFLSKNGWFVGSMLIFQGVQILEFVLWQFYGLPVVVVLLNDFISLRIDNILLWSNHSVSNHCTAEIVFSMLNLWSISSNGDFWIAFWSKGIDPRYREMDSMYGISIEIQTFPILLLEIIIPLHLHPYLLFPHSWGSLFIFPF